MITITKQFSQLVNTPSRTVAYTTQDGSRVLRGIVLEQTDEKCLLFVPQAQGPETLALASKGAEPGIPGTYVEFPLSTTPTT